MSGLRNLERLLLIFGVLMVSLYLAAQLHRIVSVDVELQQFKDQQAASADEPHGVALKSATPNVSLWSGQRIRDYRESLTAHFAPAIAILRIPKIRLEVPVLAGTDDLSLNRGVGHLAGTANPGENGNVAIAGHRDGFFRGLKDVRLGDKIEIDALGRPETYVIDRITIVDPNDVSVLKPTPLASLTLVTCYPFYFVGSAPKRYIVHAVVANAVPANANASRQLRSE
jgi:sortase A